MCVMMGAAWRRALGGGLVAGGGLSGWGGSAVGGLSGGAQRRGGGPRWLLSTDQLRCRQAVSHVIHNVNFMLAVTV